MRAVNLLPPDMRGPVPAGVQTTRPEPAQGIGAYVVLGVLAACVAMLAAYVLAGNVVKQRQADLVQVSAEADAAAQEAAKLRPYADFEATTKARVETVRGLAAARFDWEQAIRDLSRAVPRDAKLSNLTGDMGLPGTTGDGADPLRGSIQAPAITLTGCASSQRGVARLLARLRAVDGVTRVSLSKSEVPDDTSSSACRGSAPPAFSAVVFFERADSLAEMAPQPSGATTPEVPVPNAVNGDSADASAPSTSTSTPGAAAP